MTTTDINDPALDDFFENFWRTPKPGERTLADMFEELTVKARSVSNLDAANYLQELANAMRHRLIGFNISTHLKGIRCESGSIFEP